MKPTAFQSKIFFIMNDLQITKTHFTFSFTLLIPREVKLTFQNDNKKNESQFLYSYWWENNYSSIRVELLEIFKYFHNISIVYFHVFLILAYDITEYFSTTSIARKIFWGYLSLISVPLRGPVWKFWKYFVFESSWKYFLYIFSTKIFLQ